MPLINAFTQNSMSDPYRYATIRGVTTNFGSVDINGVSTFLPPHKGFCIVTGFTSGNTDFTIPFDILYRQSDGITFWQRMNVLSSCTFFFPVQISGISGNPTQLLSPSAAGLDQHLIYYYS